MNELSQPLFQLHAPFIVLTAKSSIEVQASITYAFVSACTDSIIISIPRGTRLFTSNSNKRDNAGLIQCIGYIYIDPSQLGCFKIEDATTDDIFAMFNIR